MNKKGIIFDIQKFSIHDGPGIRTTIFMKGCSLRCKWCHNPESISPKIQLNFDSSKCTLCKKCIKFVNGKGIIIEDMKLKINFKLHNTNLDLIDICPNRAFNQYGKEMTVDEVVKVVLQDKDYYESSGGGVTFSGGEAINQMEFIEKVAKKLIKYRINICLDISGFDPTGSIEKTTEWVDQYLLDYKVSSNEKEEKYLGKKIHFTEIIENLSYNNKKIILRCPIIPNVNNYEQHFKNICKISKKYKNIEYVDILPYHNLKKKYEFYKKNSPIDYDVPSNEEIKKWISFIKKEERFKIYFKKNKI